MEFFPLAAVGVGLAAVGTLLLLFLVMLFRTRLTSANSRGPGNPANNSNNSHPLEKPNSLMLTSGLTTTTNNTSSATNNSAGYRPVPQSKSEADANPDIIPGANNFSADYKEELQRTLSRKGMYISTSGSMVQEANGQHNHAYANNTLPKSHPHTTQQLGSGNGTYHHHPPQATAHHPHHPHVGNQQQQHQYQTLHHPKSNYVKDYPPPHYHPHHHPHHPTTTSPPPPANDYNTIYIRDKLLHDSDIPESCV